jgi:AcrR family transcriptional regulator
MASTSSLKRRRNPRQERSRATVEAILEAAAQVFERHGYAAGTTNRIAERAGVSIGSLYQYFPNKGAIVVEVMRRHMAEAGEVGQPVLQELVDQVPPLHDGLTAIVAAMIAVHERSPRLHRVLSEEAPHPPEILALQRALFDGLGRMIGEYLAASPEVTVADPALAGRIVAQVVDAVTHGLVIHPRPGDEPSVYASETVRMLERYVSG